MVRNQFGDFADLDPDPYVSNCVDPDPDTINPDLLHYVKYSVKVETS